jgi:hypothetical protein
MSRLMNDIFSLAANRSIQQQCNKQRLVNSRYTMRDNKLFEI